jgi:hypothetical protein
MDGVRARNGKGGNNMETDNVEENKNLRQELENLEAKGGYRTLCSVEVTRPVMISNRFAGLETEEYSEEDYTNYEGPPGLQGWTPVVRKSLNQIKKEAAKNKSQAQMNSEQPDARDLRGTKTGAVPVMKNALCGGRATCGSDSRCKYSKRDTPAKYPCEVPEGVCFGALDSLELNTVNFEKGEREMTITIDSGASENVIGPSMLPTVPVVESEGSKEGVMYVTANGTVMPNRGEQHIHVTTQEGHKCMLNMQVTDVKKPLMSVARICDAGHEVTFSSSGGMIKHMKTGQVTRFDRVDNVYRLKVGLASGFARPGQQ